MLFCFISTSHNFLRPPFSPPFLFPTSPFAQVVATGSADATVRVWSVADGACLRTLEGHIHSVLRLAFVSRGMQLVTRWEGGEE